MASATSRVRRSWLSVTTTRAPPAASRRATACPRPKPAAAVTSAIRPPNSSFTDAPLVVVPGVPQRRDRCIVLPSHAGRHGHLVHGVGGLDGEQRDAVGL